MEGITTGSKFTYSLGKSGGCKGWGEGTIDLSIKHINEATNSTIIRIS